MLLQLYFLAMQRGKTTSFLEIAREIFEFHFFFEVFNPIKAESCICSLNTKKHFVKNKKLPRKNHKKLPRKTTQKKNVKHLLSQKKIIKKIAYKSKS